MATESPLPDIGKEHLEKLELQTFEASLRELVPLIKCISPGGMLPYTKMQAPQNGGQ